MKGFQTNCRFVMEIVFFASKRVIDIQGVKGIDLNCQLSLHLSFLKNLRRVSEQLWREYYGMSLHGLKWRVFNFQTLHVFLHNKQIQDENKKLVVFLLPSLKSLFASFQK